LGLLNRKKAYISPSKLNDYLLSRTHPTGRWKAEFFRSFGFDETNAEILRESLMSIAHSSDVKEVVPSPYDIKYIIDGSIQSPSGNFMYVRTVWIIEKDDDNPYLVTVYPL